MKHTLCAELTEAPEDRSVSCTCLCGTPRQLRFGRQMLGPPLLLRSHAHERHQRSE